MISESQSSLNRFVYSSAITPTHFITIPRDANKWNAIYIILGQNKFDQGLVVHFTVKFQ